MREILFRGKTITSKEWIYGDLLQYAGGAQIWENTEQGKFNAQIIPETVGQYTGLKDVHGTRIFEGDVVKSIAAWYVVEFENGGYGLRPFGKGKLIPIMGHGNFNENEVEVIDNVYDNQELLEGDKT